MVRTRFAPSPTGFLHIGGLRTALYAYMYAKKQGGKFILRLEDTDRERYIEGAADIIYSSLKDAGLLYDEGPDVGGEFGPYIQSERKDLYRPLAEKLVENGGAYYCFCSKERLEEMKAAGATKYDKKCCAIPLDEARKRAAAGEPYVIRQNIPESGKTSYTDMVFGEITVDCKDLEDGVLIKSDGMPTYNFANVVDDYLMDITHVIRGVEYLSSTPKYNLMYEGLGWAKPAYIHLQPIMRDATHKLSKRDGDASFEDFIKKGYLKEAIINYIALLGWSPKDDREKMSLEEMTSLFGIEGISKSSSVFDENKMRWLNSLYVKELSVEEFHAHALPFYDKLSYLDSVDKNYLSELLHSRTEIFSDVAALTAFLTEFDGYDLTLLENKKWKTDAAFAGMHLPALIELTKTRFDDLSEAIAEYAEKAEVKKGSVLWIYRIALTGAAVTPGGAAEMARLVGKDAAIERLTATQKRLNG